VESPYLSHVQSIDFKHLSLPCAEILVEGTQIDGRSVALFAFDDDIHLNVTSGQRVHSSLDGDDVFSCVP
jgi:hypothetical protein